MGATEQLIVKYFGAPLVASAARSLPHALSVVQRSLGHAARAAPRRVESDQATDQALINELFAKHSRHSGSESDKQ